MGARLTSGKGINVNTTYRSGASSIFINRAGGPYHKPRRAPMIAAAPGRSEEEWAPHRADHAPLASGPSDAYEVYDA